MNILHYFLGFPPYRSGGLTRFAVDLMATQYEEGNLIMALWPGKIIKIGGIPRIQEREKHNGIVNYELINPLPVPLDEGIKDFKAYTMPCDIWIYQSFLEKIRPDVIHIHTLMGIHNEFIQAANKLKIRTVFTSHDYFGLCPKVTFYRYGQCCDNDHGCRDCIQCNLSALSLRKIQILQSHLYRALKNSGIIRMLRRIHRSKFFDEEILPQMPEEDIEENSIKYQNLRSYYVNMLESIDLIHFNSTVAQNVYLRFITPKNSSVVSITHRKIKAHKLKREKNHEKKVILYLAAVKPYKGFNILKNALDQLWIEGRKDFELRVFSAVKTPAPYMVIRDKGFTQEELEDIMLEADVLVAPSIWYETFGFTVLEAMSYGIPVIVSDHVGAKDIVGRNGIVVKAGDVDELKEAIVNINQIDGKTDIKEWTTFMKENYSLYKNQEN